MKEIKLVYHRFDEDDLVTNVVVNVSGQQDIKQLAKSFEEAGEKASAFQAITDKLKDFDIQRFAGKKQTDEQKRLADMFRLIDKASKQDLVSDTSVSKMKSMVSMAKNFNTATGIDKDAGSVFETLTERFGVSKPEAFQAMSLSGEKLYDELKLNRDEIKGISKEFDKIKKNQLEAAIAAETLTKQEEKRKEITNRINSSREESINSAKNEAQIIDITNKHLEKRMSLLKQELSARGESGIVTDSPISELQELKRVMMGRNEETALGFLQQNAGNINVLSMEKIKEGFAGAREEAQKFKDTTQTISDAVFDKMDEKGVAAFSNINQEIHWSDQAVESLLGKTKELSNTFVRDTLSSAVRFGRTLSRIWDSLFRIGSNKHNPYGAYSKYVESANLFNTSFGKGLEETDGKIHDFSDRAQEWADRISKGLHLDPVELYQYSGALYSLVKGMGVAEEQAYVMGTNLTQLAYDMTSYLNLESYEAGFEKIRSAISGQSRAVATAGVPMQMESLEELADALGIDKSVSKMTQAEKTVMRYIALMRATGDIQMDLGKTINSPENALKSLKQSLQMVSVAIGQLITPIITKAIPLFIALANVIQEAAQSLAKFFGIEIDSDYSRGSSAFTDIFNNISESADGATGSINRSLAAFDDLNVVESEGSGSGTGGGGSVLQELYDFIDSYDMLGKLKKEFNESISSMETKIKSLIPWVLGATGAFVIFKSAVKLGNTVNWISKVGGSISNISSWFNKSGSVSDAISKSKEAEKAVNSTDSFGKTVNSSFGTWGDFTTKIKQISEMVGLLGVVIIEVGGLMAIIGGLSQIPGIKYAVSEGIDVCVDIFVGILKMMPGLAGLTGLAYVIQKVSPIEMAKGFGELALLIAGTSVLVGAIGIAANWYGPEIIDSGVNTLEKVFGGVLKIIVPLGLMTGLSALIGIGSSVILPGFGVLALIIAATEGLVVMIGNAATWWGPDVIDTGIETMVKIFEGIGRMAGALVEGAIIQISSSLPLVGTNLSDFIANSKDFFDTIKNIGPETLNGAANLTGAISKLAVDGFINSISTILTGRARMAAMGDALTEFAPKMKSYAETIAGIDSKAVNASANIVESICKYIEVATNKTLLDRIFGSSTPLTDYGEDLKSFGEAMVDYARSMAQVDPDIITRTDAAVKSVLKYAELSPKYNGLKQLFTGDSSISIFGTQLKSFGVSLMNYAFSVGQITKDDLDHMDRVTESVEKIFGWKIPESGGLMALFSNKTLGAFGKDLKEFGDDLSSFSTKIKDVSTSKMDSITKFMSNLISSLMNWNEGNLASSLSSFGTSINSIGTTLNNTFNNVFSATNANNLGYNFGNNLGAKIKSALKSKLGSTLEVSSGISKLTKYSISLYADGGMPNSGDLFFANENGAAEYITSVGNRTAVANQDQMVQAITGAITQSLGNVGGRNGDVVVYIGNDKVYQGQGTYQSRQSDRYGTTYVKI